MNNREMLDLHELLDINKPAKTHPGQQPSQPRPQSHQHAQQPHQPTPQPDRKPVEKSEPSEDRTKDRYMVICLKWIRFVVAVLNVAPYTLVVAKLLQVSGLGGLFSLFSWLAAIPGWGGIIKVVGGVLLFAGAVPLWYLLQRMETMEGRGSWKWKTFAYTVDVIATIATFPPINGGWAGVWLFLTAPSLSDLNLFNITVNLVALFAWEVFDNFERHYFGSKAKYNFWGVVAK